MGTGTFSFGDANVATGDNSIAGGSGCQSSGLASVALGDTSIATDDGAFAAGYGAEATAQGAAALGYFAGATGLGCFAANAGQSSGTTSAAFGEASADGLDSVAFGKSAAHGSYSASFGQSTAVNTADFAQGEGTTAQGGASHSTGDSALAGVYSQHAYASSFGFNSSSGMNAQGGGEIVMSGTCAGGAGSVVLEFGQGGTGVFPVSNTQAYSVTVRGVAVDSTTTDSASFNYVFLMMGGAIVGVTINNNPSSADPTSATVFNTVASAVWDLPPSIVGGNLEFTFSTTNPYANDVNIAAVIDWTEVAVAS